MKDTHKEKLIAAYLSGNAAAREEEELMAWIDESPESRKFFDKTVALWRIADQGDSPDFSKGKSQAWNKLNTRLFTDVEQPAPTAKLKPIRGLLFSKAFGIAASLALLLAVGWWWQSSKIFTVQTLASERTLVDLPDGTQVWMNENSSLSYEDAGKERILTFEGEAYFDVQTDSLKPFKIYSGRTVTTVMGTAFNLRAYPQENAVEVSVTEGKVAFTDIRKEKQQAGSVELTPGQTGVFEKEYAIVTKREEHAVQNIAAWKNKQLVFNNIKLTQVLADMERYFDVNIILEDQNLLDCIFTGEYNEPTLDQILNILSFTFNFDTKMDGDTIHLTGGFCQ